MKIKQFFFGLFPFLFLHAETSEKMSDVFAEKHSLPIDLSLYGSVYLHGRFYPGISIRTQRQANGVELDFSTLPFSLGNDWKTSLSYLYHFGGARTGVYFGTGVGCASVDQHFCPTFTGFIGLQSSPNPGDGKGFHGFVDVGLFNLIENFPTSVFFPVPEARAGVGISF
jgi:hypothetical protein